MIRNTKTKSNFQKNHAISIFDNKSYVRNGTPCMTLKNEMIQFEIYF